MNPRVAQVKVEVAVELGSRTLRVSEALQMVPGAVIPLGVPCGAPATVRVAGHAVALAEVVAVGERYGARLVSSPRLPGGMGRDRP